MNRSVRVVPEAHIESVLDRFRHAFDASIVGMSLLDLRGHFIRVNPAMCSLLGRSENELLGMTWQEVTHSDDVEHGLGVVSLIESGDGDHRFEKRYIHSTGRVVWVQANVSVVHDDAGRPTCLFNQFFDISARKKAEEALRSSEQQLRAMIDSASAVIDAKDSDDVTRVHRLQEQLQQSQKMEALGRLAAGVAHDFNNLLTVIQNCAGFLAEDIEPDDERRDDVNKILAAGERGATLIRQLLSFSRSETVSPRVLDLNQPIANLQELLRRTIAKDVELVVDLQPGLWQVMADPGQVERVIVNLIVNARDAMPDGGTVTISTSNYSIGSAAADSVDSALLERYVCLTVDDTGTGMSDDVRRRLFEPFFTTKGPGSGTGLGLAVVHSVVAQTGGHLSVESEEGSGATFRIFLPAVPDSAAG